MSLESILQHIIEEANFQKEKIIQEAKQEAHKIIQLAKLDAEELYRDILNQEKGLYERQKQKIMVNARLEDKKSLLASKQELIDAVFVKLKSTLKKDKFKKEQIFQNKTQELAEDLDFYLNKIRPDYETEIAQILFE